MPKKKQTAAEAEGSTAFTSGVERSSNPYAPGDFADQWERGWKYGKRKAYFRGEPDALDQERDQMMGLDAALSQLAPKRLRHYPSWVWVALVGIAVFVIPAGGLIGLLALAAMMGFLYVCIATFVLVRHFAGKHGDTPGKKVLSYTLGGVLGLIIVLIMWEIMLFVLGTLESLL